MRNSSGRGSRPDVPGTFGATVRAVAGGIPAYSPVATTAVLVGAAGLAAPAALLYCALPVLGIVLAYRRLERLDLNAGAAYSWVGRTLHPFLGFLCGWALVVSTTLFMVAGALPAGMLTLALFDPGPAKGTWPVTAAAAGWLVVMLLVALVGVRLTVRARTIVSCVELVLLLLFVLGAAVRNGAAAAFDWSWLGFGDFCGVSGVASGALIAAFSYRSRYACGGPGEEGRGGRFRSGLPVFVGVGVVFLLLEAFTLAVNVVLATEGVTARSGAGTLALLCDALWPGFTGKLLVVVVMLSTVVTLETTLIQVTRTLFTMGRDRTVPAVFGLVHRRRNTPRAAVAAVGGVALALFAASNAFGSVGDVVSGAVGAMSLQLAFSHGLAGIAAVVAYRRVLLSSARELLLGGVWPLAGAAFMWWIFYESLVGLPTAPLVIGLGGLAAGLIPMFWYWRRGSSYYRPAKLDAVRALAAKKDMPCGDVPRRHRPAADETLATDF
ncbi:amino acid permease [Streptomyces somaliensis DSM 40738]|uniref:APC family permease n=1 Tax=Streptomyces somaliensis (strain ATCC 33201 / DSM 40738 / JCM 12659 / KCTC 9044 / NCTC 11332 / NRRL B-12077 / IP 733) TaxID=1134445 RepID=A0AA44DC25_STRE0|nr:amino acid permease [Streptomyces somaliensis]MCQ0024818.1 amino acid permease [Streptomyces somaliensis DSM 40738]NKY13698.1 APC family permease [Streptomyces somaliensis DSM 40738]